jgi:probable F420-dependent oxidoreductase
MKFGITAFLTDYSIDPASFAREVEARGFHSMWTPEHTHIPSARKTPAPMGEPLPKQYSHSLDPFVALSYAAAATEKLRVGTGICLVAQHDPIVLAKKVATLDHLSGGRFDFGIGFGWNREEMEHHGVPYDRRRRFVRERVLAMKELWSKDEASYDGEFVRFEETWSWPKPVQKPHPPLYIGGMGGPTLFEHVAEWSDGWIPIGGRGIRDRLPSLREQYERNGRDPDSIKIIPFGSLPSQGKLEYFASMGIEEVVLGVDPGGPDVVLPILDAYAKEIEALVG